MVWRRFTRCQSRAIVGHGLDVARGRIVDAVYLSASIGRTSTKLSDLQIRRLIHIDPKRIDVNASLGIEEAGKLIVPVLLHVGVKPVRKYSGTGPDAAFVEATICLLDEDVGFHTVVVGIIGLRSDSL